MIQLLPRVQSSALTRNRAAQVQHLPIFVITPARRGFGSRRACVHCMVAAAAVAVRSYQDQKSSLTAPASYAEAMASQAAPLWQEAMAAEQLKLGAHGTFSEHRGL
jgi:hypothetical protein